MRLIAFPQWDKLTSLLRGMARQSAAGREGVPHQRLHRNGHRHPPDLQARARRFAAAHIQQATRSCPATSGPPSATGSTPPATTTSSSRNPLRPLRGSRYALRQPDRFAVGALPKTSAKTTRSSPPPVPASLSPTPKSPPSSPRVPPTNYSQTSLCTLWLKPEKKTHHENYHHSNRH